MTEDNHAWVVGLKEVSAVGPVQISALGQGAINRSWRVESAAGVWVVRRNAAGAGVERSQECLALRRAAAADLAPEPVACCDAYLITRWLDGREWDLAQLEDADALDQLARRLRELHRLDVEGLAATNWADRLPELLAFSPSKEEATLRREVSDLAAELRVSSLTVDQHALCHGDLHLGQLLGRNPIRFIDFEYACRANPMLDLAWLVQQHDLTPDQQLPLLAAYFGGADPYTRKLLALALRLVRLLEFFWLEARLDQGYEVAGGESRLRQLRLVLA
ncbi:MAG: phosphotransferase [Pseudomonadota bacterium]